MIEPKPCEHCGHAPSRGCELKYNCGRYPALEPCACPCHDRADAIVAAVMQWHARLQTGEYQTGRLAPDLAYAVIDALKAHPLPKPEGQEQTK